VNFLRILARLILVAIAAALFVGLAGLWARSIHAPRFKNFRGVPIEVRRPPEPQFSALPKFLGEGFLIAAIAIAGRKLFRLRLTD
jgi:hypothetical protein